MERFVLCGAAMNWKRTENLFLRAIRQVISCRYLAAAAGDLTLGKDGAEDELSNGCTV